MNTFSLACIPNPRTPQRMHVYSMLHKILSKVVAVPTTYMSKPVIDTKITGQMAYKN